MPSFKSHLYAFVIRHTRKKSFTSVEGMHARLKAARRTEDHRPPKTLSRRVDIAEREVGGAPVYEVTPKGGAGSSRIIFLHGGACLFEITAHHWKLIVELAERLVAQITVSIYPLAPETKALDTLETIMALYRDVLAKTPAGDIAFMGDSAGGNLAVVTAMLAAKENLPQPAALVLISPALDPSMTNPAIVEVEKRDPWLAAAGGQEATRLYAGDLDFSDWRITPLNGDVSILPPGLILTGTHDILNPDTRLFIDKAREAGVEIELLEEKGMFHVWPLLNMPEALAARDRMVTWLENRFA